jgi:hypothetical protein
MARKIREFYGPELPIFRAISVIFISRLLRLALSDGNSPAPNALASEAMVALRSAGREHAI